jgi:hypothetical protein
MQSPQQIERCGFSGSQCHAGLTTNFGQARESQGNAETHKTDEDILNLPFTQDRFASNAVKLLVRICTYCLLKDEVEMAVFSALLATQLTLKHGLAGVAVQSVRFCYLWSCKSLDREYRQSLPFR